jgi:hypothetical protein
MGKAFCKAAEKALLEWHSDQWDRQKDELDDLVQDLWVWYLERKGTQAKLETLSYPEVVETVRQAAIQMLSKQVLDSNTFQGKDLYSSDSVKEALAGKSTNKYLLKIMPLAREALNRRNAQQGEAIRSRYEDGVVPQPPLKQVLQRAVKSLTEEVNVIYLTTDEACIGSRHAVFPESRRVKGEHSDPTGNTAILLMENPSVRYEYMKETPLTDFISGDGTVPYKPMPQPEKAGTPWFGLEGAVCYRPTSEEAAILRKYPQLIVPFLDKKRGELCSST